MSYNDFTRRVHDGLTAAGMASEYHPESEDLMQFYSRAVTVRMTVDDVMRAWTVTMMAYHQLSPVGLS